MVRWPQQKIPSQQIFTYLMIAAMVCLLIPERFTNKLDHLLSFLVGPLSQSSREGSLAVSNALRQRQQPTVNFEEYQKLLNRSQREQRELINLNQQVDHLKEMTLRLTGVKQQYGLERVKLVAAHITGSDSSSLREIKKLDQGSAEGVQAGQLVLAWSDSGGSDAGKSNDKTELYQKALQGAVVGKIIDSARDTSSLQLLSDPGLRMKVVLMPNPGRKEKWQAEGLLQGEGLGRVTVTKVPATAEYTIRRGDVVLALPEAKILPVAMLIGWVQSCQPEEQNPVLWQIQVRPAVELHPLREVIIIKP